MTRNESQVLIKSMRVNTRLVTGELHDAAISFFGLGDGPLNKSFAQSTSPVMLVILTGFFQNGVNFGGATLTSAGLYDIFLAKFDTAGADQWSRRFGDVDS